METNQSATAKACCADLYQTELARSILGETRHPGGLRLTHRLGRLMGIRENDLVLDLASGNGSSALALSRTFRCRVIGLDFGRQATEVAVQTSRDAPVPGQAWFMQGDAESPPFGPEVFDSAVLECSLSLFPDKVRAIAQTASTLKPGGILGISDVTMAPNSLPRELEGSLGQMLCLTDALDAEGYVGLLETAGLRMMRAENVSEEIGSLLTQIRTGLAALSFFQGSPTFGPDSSPDESSHSIADWGELIGKLEKLVETGRLGYWIFVAQKA